MDVLVCVKRVPAPGTRIVLTDDEQEIVTRNLGFAVSPHEECAVEEAVRLKEKHGGTTTVMTLGEAVSADQLRDAMAMGIDRAILLETDQKDWGPMATANAIVKAIQAEQVEGRTFDILLFGNESADNGGYQVGIRVAHALDMPCVGGIKGLEVGDGTAVGIREVSGGQEHYEVSLPALFTTKEGINLPRYPSLPGRLRAKKKPIANVTPERGTDGLEKVRLKVPQESGSEVEYLGEGPAAAPRIVELLRELKLFED